MKQSIMIDGRPAQGKLRGVGVYTSRLIRALASIVDKPVDIHVALNRKSGGDPWEDLPDLVRVWGTAGNQARWEQVILPRLAHQAKADLLHCTANSSPLHCKIPHVVTVHDAIFIRRLLQISGTIYPKQVLAHYYHQWTIGRGARRADCVITDSQFSKSELIKKIRLDPEKVDVIPLADPHQTPPLPESKVKEIIEQHKIRRPYLLGFGAIDLRKNTANLVRAFARLPRSAADMLVLTGFEKHEKSLVPNLIKQFGMHNRIKILGYISEKELTALFQAAAAFVYPSKMEGFGLPILQAFRLGVPVITTNAGSIPEVAGNAVRLVEPDDPRSICQAILTVLIDSNEAHRLALTGYLQAKKFTWEKTAQSTLEVYARVLHYRKKE
ncbi:glycosyltransferase family 4 protein [bacterium]|nr:glycosyltransferase family 4 protein [bacterium]